MKKYLLCFPFFILPALAEANYDRCNDILRQGAFNTLYTSDSNSYKLARHHVFCSTAKQFSLNESTFGAFAKDYARKTKAHRHDLSNDTDVSIGPFKWVGGGSNKFHTNDLDEDLSERDKEKLLQSGERKILNYYRDRCDNDQVDAALQNEAIFLRKVASSEVARAWVDCMKNNTKSGLFIDLIPEDENSESNSLSYSLELQWRSEFGQELKAVALETGSNITLARTPDVSCEGRKIYHNVVRGTGIFYSDAFQIEHTPRERAGILTFSACVDSPYAAGCNVATVRLPRKVDVSPIVIKPTDVPKQKVSRIVDLRVVYQDSKGAPVNGEYSYHPQDLNEDHGGKFIYVGYKTSTQNTDKGISNIGFISSKNELSEREISDAFNQRGFTNHDLHDLNKGAGGKYIYMGWRKDESDVNSIGEIHFKLTDSREPPFYGEGWVPYSQDLCEGAGGKYMFCYVKRVNG